MAYDASYQFSAVKYARYHDELMDYDFFRHASFASGGGTCKPQNTMTPSRWAIAYALLKE